jgi:hypothetical protein
MQASPEVQRALATIHAVLEDLAPEAPLAVGQPSTSEVEAARQRLAAGTEAVGAVAMELFARVTVEG